MGNPARFEFFDGFQGIEGNYARDAFFKIQARGFYKRLGIVPVLATSDRNRYESLGVRFRVS